MQFIYSLLNIETICKGIPSPSSTCACEQFLSLRAIPVIASSSCHCQRFLSLPAVPVIASSSCHCEEERRSNLISPVITNFILALVQVLSVEESETDCSIRYVQQPFQKEPDFAVTSINYNLQELWQRGFQPT